MEAGGDFVQINEVTSAADGQPDLLFTLDRTKIDSVGAPAIYEFLKKLQVTLVDDLMNYSIPFLFGNICCPIFTPR